MNRRIAGLMIVPSLAVVMLAYPAAHAEAKGAKADKSATPHADKKGQNNKGSGGQSSPDMLTDLEASDLATTALAALEESGSTSDSVTNLIEKKILAIRASRSSSAPTTQPATMPSSMSRLTQGQLQVLGRTIDTRFVAGIRGQALSDAIRTQANGMLEAADEKANKGAKEPKQQAKSTKKKA